VKVKCVKSDYPFYKEGKEYGIDRTFIGNVGDTKGIHYTVIRVEHEFAKHVKTADLDSGNCDFVRIE
jgi:hypothetical protein